MNGIAESILQATLCLITIAAIRVAIVSLGSKIGAILLGTPTIIFPLLAIQAWQGPPVVQAQTLGTIASLTALNAALWMCRLPISPGPLPALLVLALSWLVGVIFIYAAGVPDWLMAGALIVNGVFVLIWYRGHRGTALASRGRVTDGAIVTAAFLIFFFLVTRLVPDFLRGVLVGFPVGALATVYFVRRVLPQEAFTAFIVYFQGSILSGVMFVVVVHYSLILTPIALALAISLSASLGTTIIIGRVWRSPKLIQPEPESGVVP
jgi:hypothetical protein